MVHALAVELAPVLAAKVWHYWIAVPLAGGAVVATVATVAGYFRKVESLKYPPRGVDRE